MMRIKRIIYHISLIFKYIRIQNECHVLALFVLTNIYVKQPINNKMKTSEFRKLIHEEVRKVLTEAQTPTYQAKHKDNNLVVAIYFSWNKAESNNQSLWDKVIQVIEQADCKLINYVVTDSVCEFEFQPIGAYDQDVLETIKYDISNALKPLASKFTGYDVYIAGN